MNRTPIRHISLSNSDIDATLEDFIEADGNASLSLGGDYNRLVAEIENTDNSVVFTDFALLAQYYPNGSWAILLSNTNWSSVTGILLDFLGAPDSLAANGKAFIMVDVGGLHAVKFQGKTAGDGEGTVKCTVSRM